MMHILVYSTFPVSCCFTCLKNPIYVGHALMPKVRIVCFPFLYKTKMNILMKNLSED